MGGDLILRKIIENIKENKKEHWITAIIGLFFGTICSVFVNVFFHFDEVPLNFWSTIIASLITVFGVGATIYATSRNLEKNMSKQDDRAQKNLEAQKNSLEKQLKLQEQIKHYEIEANIISKARIEWIQEARHIVLEYLSVCEELKNSLYLMDINSKSKSYEGYKEKAIEIQSRLKLIFLKFKLFLGDDREGADDKNGAFITCMEEPCLIAEYELGDKKSEVTLSLIEKIVGSDYDDNDYSRKIKYSYEVCEKKIVNYARGYFKDEWIRVSTKDEDNDK